jgi:hypothetical protein
MKKMKIAAGFAASSMMVCTLIAALPARTSALEEHKNEKDRLKACELKVCSLITKKIPAPGNLSCTLTKTWSRDRLKEGSASGKVSWGFGDARCTVDLSLQRSALIDALKNHEATFHFHEHLITCDIESDGEVKKVTARIAPKVQFKDGLARKIWVNLKHVEGPATMKGIAYTAAKLEDTVGIFHKPLIKAVNKMITERCPKVMSGS